MTSSTYTLVKLGYSDPRTDTFGAHPLLGPVLDLNDGATFTLLSPDGLELSAPEKTLVPTGNVRTQGERVTRAIYRRNRTAVLRVILGPASSYAALVASVRSLVRWLDAAPATPITVQWQAPSATSPVYLDVVGAAHGIPADEREWLRLQLEPVEIVLLVRPGLRGDRLTLSNLVSNPGFEAPSTGNYVFNDSFANLNAYTLASGSAPSLAANVATLPGGCILTFGSPSWGPLRSWYIRFQMPTGGVVNPKFCLHFQDVNNRLTLSVTNSQIQWEELIGGTVQTLATTACTLTSGNWYWALMTQFPAAPGTQADVQGTVYNDSAGAVGAQVASVGPVATYDGSSSLSGHCAIWGNNTNSMLIGGAYSGVNALTTYGPGAWNFMGASGGAMGLCSGAWEQNLGGASNTYAGGAVASFAAARIDLPPAGTVNASWESYSGGSPIGSPAIPASAGQTLGVSAYARSTGLSATATMNLQVREWDTNGALLRATTIQTLTGNQAAWAALSGTLTLGASTAYVSLLLAVADATAGASAGGAVWFDNAQCWNVTTTGQSSMPYCELRFPQSPAQLLVTGLQGDLPAPAHAAWGTFLASWGPNGTLLYALGRRARASARAQLVGSSVGFYGAALSPTSTAALDSGSYGGYYAAATVNPGWNPRAFSFPPSDLLGVYHLFSRFYTAQSAGNLGNVQTRVVTQQKTNPWYGTIGDADQMGAYNGPFVAPLSASATWTVCDSGQVNVPALPAGALTDLTQNYLTPRSQWEDLTSGGSACRSDWQMLLPIDGSLLVGVVNNPSNGTVTVTNQWLWAYHDGLLVNRAAVGDAAATTYSLESAPASNPAHGAGGPGTSSTGAINVNSGADPYLTLDPTVSSAAVANVASGGNGVNQFAGYVAGGTSGSVLALHVELQYSPLYLYPR